jgi:hypothetical protein
MYLAEDRSRGQSYLVFTEVDPREDGFTGSVTEDVFLDVPEGLFLWPDGHGGPEPCVGQDPTDANRYKVFKYSRDLQKAGYRPVSATFDVYERWSEYERIGKTTTDASRDDAK